MHLTWNVIQFLLGQMAKWYQFWITFFLEIESYLYMQVCFPYPWPPSPLYNRFYRINDGNPSCKDITLQKPWPPYFQKVNFTHQVGHKSMRHLRDWNQLSPTSLRAFNLPTSQLFVLYFSPSLDFLCTAFMFSIMGNKIHPQTSVLIEPIQRTQGWCQ